MTVTITNNTVNPILLVAGTAGNAYSGVTVNDDDRLTTTETVTIKLSQSLSNDPGNNFSFFPTGANLGTITDPLGGGVFNPANNTFTEQGLIGGTPNFATALLKRLVYTPPNLSNGQGLASQAQVTVTDNSFGFPTATTPFNDPVITGVVAPPAIAGTVANEPVMAGKSINPFATVNTTIPNFSYNYFTYTRPSGAQFSTYNPVMSYNYPLLAAANITITEGGTPTDADGLLTGSGLSKTGVGTYAVLPGVYYNVQSEIRGSLFQTNAGQNANPTFTLTVVDQSSGLASTDPTTSVLVIAPPDGKIIKETHNEVPIVNPIWFQQNTGPVSLWSMNGATITDSGEIGNPGPTWAAIGTGNFFGDGDNTILWQNLDGTVALWHLDNADGTKFIGGGGVANPGPAWHVIGPDGNKVFFQHDNGFVAEWELNGTTFTGGGGIGNPSPVWHVEAIGNNFFGNGNSDILFQHDDGTVAIWDMNGTNIVGGGGVANPGTAWHIKGTGDFYGDGHQGIAWQHDHGTVALWEMNGTTFINGGVVGDPGPTWHVKATGDYNFDGHTDLAFQNDNGLVALWELNGTNFVGGGVVTNPGSSFGMFDDRMKFISSSGGNETLAATAAPDEFVLTNPSAGTHTVAGFSLDQDVIELSRAQFSSFAGVQAATSSIAGGSMINLGGESSLLLAGIDPASLHASNFVMA